MAWTLAAKIEAEHFLREFLRSYDLPQPDEVEYGFTCVRFIYHESKTCVVMDLDPEDSHGNSSPGTHAG